MKLLHYIRRKWKNVLRKCLRVCVCKIYSCNFHPDSQDSFSASARDPVDTLTFLTLTDASSRKGEKKGKSESERARKKEKERAKKRESKRSRGGCFVHQMLNRS